jgi:hypothetical protein
MYLTRMESCGPMAPMVLFLIHYNKWCIYCLTVKEDEEGAYLISQMYFKLHR